VIRTQPRQVVFLLPFVAVILVGGIGCATPYDYSAYQAHMPRSILVLPPLNESVDANAPYSYLTTISRPLAERGYYVYPVSLIDAFMKDNGLPTPGEMHSVSLRKLGEIIGPDAVLYITIEEFAQKYLVLKSNTTVVARARLVDVDTGTEIWDGKVKLVQSSGGGGGGIEGLITAAIVAAVEQIADSVADRTHDVARMANQQLIYDKNRGMLTGPLHPEFGKTDED
jgi:hypothetical protein